MNGLMLNSKETQCIFIGSRQILAHVPSDTVIKVDGEFIIPSNNVKKKIGFHIDRFMLFDKHIDQVTKKVIGTLMFLGRVSANLDKPSRIVVVQALVLSIMNFCIRIWGTTNQTIINKVQKVQNYAAKVATGAAKKFDHVTLIFKELKWMRIKEKYEYDIYHCF